MSEAVVKLTDVWKIFGARAEEAMTAVKSQGIGKPEVLSQFQCVVGLQAPPYECPRAEI